MTWFMAYRGDTPLTHTMATDPLASLLIAAEGKGGFGFMPAVRIAAMVREAQQTVTVSRVEIQAGEVMDVCPEVRLAERMEGRDG